MTPNEQKAYEWEKEFDNRFTPDWWMGFGTTEDINKEGIGGIKSFIASQIAQARADERRRIGEELGDKWRLARFIHEKYERYAFIFGWNTQEKTKVPFEELPEENKKTMLAVADDLLSLINKE